MGFDVAADAYDRFMGRYSVLLSAQLAELAGVAAGQRVIDVGCGPGALTAELVARVGAVSVAAIDPSESFVEAARARNPGADVGSASAEELPFPDDTFDSALAQLVVQFMSDPAGVWGRWLRVTRTGGAMVACVWDHGGGRGAARARSGMQPGCWSPKVEGESLRTGTSEGELRRLFEEVGLADVTETAFVGGRQPPDVRGVVGAVHARGRPGRLLRRGTRPRSTETSFASSVAPRFRRRHSCCPCAGVDGVRPRRRLARLLVEDRVVRERDSRARARTA